LLDEKRRKATQDDVGLLLWDLHGFMQSVTVIPRSLYRCPTSMKNDSEKSSKRGAELA